MKNGAIEHIPGALLQRGSHSQLQTFGFNLLSFYFLFVNILVVKNQIIKRKVDVEAIREVLNHKCVDETIFGARPSRPCYAITVGIRFVLVC